MRALTHRDEQSIDAAKLYFVSGLSQNAIAEELRTSRSTVSKLIQHAKDRGFVDIVVHDPREDDRTLVDALTQRFHLESVSIATSPTRGYPEILQAIGRVGARVTEDLVQDGDLVGISWGTTMSAVAHHLAHQDSKGVEIVQLKGGLSYSNVGTNDMETVSLFCRAFNAYGRFMPLPVIFDTPTTRRMIEKDRYVKSLLDAGRATRTAIFTVGAMNEQALLFRLGYLSDEEKRRLQRSAVGDVCSRFFTSSGRIADRSIDERTSGITIPELLEKEHRLLIAGGEQKFDAIAVSLRVELPTMLVTDQFTAKRLVELPE